MSTADISMLTVALIGLKGFGRQASNFLLCSGPLLYFSAVEGLPLSAPSHEV